MQNIPFNIIIKKQIQDEIQKALKKIDLSSALAIQTADAMATDTESIFQNVTTYQMLIPALQSFFRYRLVSGAEPVKLTQNQVYIHPAMAYFDDLNNPVVVDGTFVDIPSYAEDRWVWVYLQEDGTYTVNKYPPNIGDNIYRIPICKIWKEHDSDDFDERTLRDIRQVGIASANLNHMLRQIFLNLFLSIPKVALDNIYVQDVSESGGVLKVKVGNINDAVLYARFTPVADTIVEVPRPETGEIVDYFVVLNATVDNYDPDDLKWEVKVKRAEEKIEVFEYPVALIKNVTIDTSTLEIINIGIQKTQKNSYIYNINLKESKLLESGEIEFDSKYIPYLGTIQAVVVNKLQPNGLFTVVVEREGQEIQIITISEEGVYYIEDKIVYPKDKIKVRFIPELDFSAIEGEIDIEVYISTTI